MQLRTTLCPGLASLLLLGCGPALDDGPIAETGGEVQAAAGRAIPGCPGVYVDPDGESAYAGLAGSYTQPYPLRGDITQLTLLTARPGGGRTVGDHQRSVWGLPRAGSYSALPSNPAIGAVLGFSEAGRESTYFVLGVQRLGGKIQALCLAGSQGAAFALRRAGL